MQGLCQIEHDVMAKLWEQGLPAIGLDFVHFRPQRPYRGQALLPQDVYQRVAHFGANCTVAGQSLLNDASTR